ncbi:alpha/beta hydrolase [Mariniflexile sp. AS56]|uniref:alpha/beta hydrolase n=1 Tax=Mariniflexile sp. AS56 TaxID=3063957 RepID=UPI0026F0F7F5|nr:alpha/beta hydrolase-fold protein [Mariniflexile sp. AS56]MDO7171728.1 alpha/beta hydrolase-fold protein [Mariniflexile sp. AS56]
MKALLRVCVFLLSQCVLCQVTIVIDSLPEHHDYDKAIYISGDFENWSGGDSRFKLSKTNNQYQISIPKQSEALSFKFTLGSWDFVECQVNGSPIENRVFHFKNTQDTLRVKIASWQDGNLKERPSTASKNVHVFAEQFEIPQLGRNRKISVYLPANYKTSGKKYPVLYMHDGQNVFDLARSYSGEWEVDETLDKLSKEHGFNIIVVAIDHGNDKRLSEYSPWSNPKYAESEGAAYIEFIVNTLKPEIDKVYRTKIAAKNTAIMGSSMGGLISHYAAIKYPHVFGKAAVFSPSFWYAKESFSFTETHATSKKVKMYYVVGGQEGENMVHDMEKMIGIMKAKKFPEANLYSKIVPNGTHSESFWKTEFEAAINWLFALH